MEVRILNMSIDIHRSLVKEIDRLVSDIQRESAMIVRLNNITRQETKTVFWSPFTPSSERAKAIKQRLTEYFTNLTNYPDAFKKIGLDNWPTIKNQLLAIQKEFEDSRPIDDQRKSIEELKEIERQHQERQAIQKAKETAFNAEAITIPTGKMGIYLNITFDDSDSMSDFFHPHSSLEERLLAIVKKQNETEKLARSVIAKIPSLKDIAFSWHTDNYSGGHGNYLMSADHQETRNHQAYDGRKEVNCRYEICFHKTYGKDIQMLPYQEYIGELEQIKLEISKQDTSPKIEYAGIPWLKEVCPENGNGHQDIVITKEGDWTWAQGEGTRALKDHLRLLGGRWSKKRAAWYFTKPITAEEILKGEI